MSIYDRAKLTFCNDVSHFFNQSLDQAIEYLQQWKIDHPEAIEARLEHDYNSEESGFMPIFYKVWETDDQMAKRIAVQEKRMIDETMRTIEHERAEYLRLKAKFES